MSDIASPSILKQSSPQLPVSWYFDQQLLELKAKMGMLGPGGGPAKQIGKGGDTVEAELVDDEDDKKK